MSMANAVNQLHRRTRTRAGLALAGVLPWTSAMALGIQFDYRFDDGFFADPARHASLEQAAAFYTPFQDNLSTIAPRAGDTWAVGFYHPARLGQAYVTVEDLAIAQDTLTVFVGASSMGSGTLGLATTGNLSVQGSAGFIDAVTTRGQTPGSDYGIWGGAIIFNRDMPWYFDATTAGLDAGLQDFLTTATHELGHILGYGEADSWNRYLVDGSFYGPASMAVYGGPVPATAAHWGEGVMDHVNGGAQETMMDPSTPRGERQLPTRLDYAGFSDMGWQVQAVPVPPAAALLFSGLLLTGACGRRTRAWR